MNVKELKDLQKKIQSLQTNEHFEILKIIKLDPLKFTENKNGIFVNMSKLKQETLVKIKNLVDFCTQNSELLEQERLKRESIRSMVEKEIQSKENIVQPQSTIVTDDSLQVDLEEWNLNDSYKETQEQINKLVTVTNSLSSQKKNPKFSGTEARIIKKSRETVEKI